MKIGIIYGGRSTEHDASLKSKENFCLNLDSRFQIVEFIFVDRKGGITLNEEPKTIGEIIDHIKNNPEVFYFNLLHGQEGEDGSWCGVLDIIDGRGSFESVNTSSILMNKYQQSIVASCSIDGLMMPKTVLFKSSDDFDAIVCKIKMLNCGKVIVKPNSMGASHFARLFLFDEFDSLLDHINKIFEYDNEVIIQEFIDGEEYTCGVINYFNKNKVLPIIHVKAESEFLDHNSKHISGKTKCDFELFKNKEKIESMSLELFKLFNIIGMCRFDFIVSGNNIYYLEGNLIPGFSDESAFPMMLKEGRIPLSDFFDAFTKAYDSNKRTNKYLPYRID